MDLQGAVALVTGASSGIGAELARALASRGSRVAISARRQERLEEVAAECRELGGDAVVLPADLGDPQAAERLGREALEQFGRIDLLVNNAGVPRRIHARRLRFADVEQTMRVNYIGPMALTFTILPAMIEAGRGEIVNVGSAAGRLVAPREAAYAASKSAVAAMSECLATDLAGTGVRVHLVTPGVIDTPLWDDPDQERTPVRGAPIPADRVVDAILDLIGSTRFERYVPRSLRAAAIMKPILGRGFLRSAARFDRRRVPEAYE